MMPFEGAPTNPMIHPGVPGEHGVNAERSKLIRLGTGIAAATLALTACANEEGPTKTTGVNGAEEEITESPEPQPTAPPENGQADSSDVETPEADDAPEDEVEAWNSLEKAECSPSATTIEDRPDGSAIVTVEIENHDQIEGNIIAALDAADYSDPVNPQVSTRLAPAEGGQAKLTLSSEDADMVKEGHPDNNLGAEVAVTPDGYSHDDLISYFSNRGETDIEQRVGLGDDGVFRGGSVFNVVGEIFADKIGTSQQLDVTTGCNSWGWDSNSGEWISYMTESTAADNGSESSVAEQSSSQNTAVEDEIAEDGEDGQKNMYDLYGETLLHFGEVTELCQPYQYDQGDTNEERMEIDVGVSAEEGLPTKEVYNETLEQNFEDAEVCFKEVMLEKWGVELDDYSNVQFKPYNLLTGEELDWLVDN